ncbi:TauD/TfdA dioxygenase family protein [Cupriavidus basilensis]
MCSRRASRSAWATPGISWHSDLSYKEKPSLGSLLHAQELPAEGGDTLFANMHLAWETLPAHLKSAVEGRNAEHTYLARYAELQQRSPWRPNLTPEQIAQVAPVLQPVVRTHPETGRRGAVRQRAFHHAHRRAARRMKAVTRWRNCSRTACGSRNTSIADAWQEHDLVFWDNRLAAATWPPAARSRCAA